MMSRRITTAAATPPPIAAMLTAGPVREPESITAVADAVGTITAVSAEF